MNESSKVVLITVTVTITVIVNEKKSNPILSFLHKNYPFFSYSSLSCSSEAGSEHPRRHPSTCHLN